MASNRNTFFSDQGQLNQQQHNHSFVFKSMSPEQGYKMLAQAKKSWLLRESRIKGMLTVDCISTNNNESIATKTSIRFALLSQPQGYSWRVIKANEIDQYKDSCQKLTTENINLDSNVTTLFNLLEEKGLEPATMLKPPIFNASQAYRGYHTDLEDDLDKAAKLYRAATSDASGPTPPAINKS